MKFNAIAFVGLLGCCWGAAGLIGACGSSARNNASSHGSGSCGDSVVDPGEQCDDGVLNSQPPGCCDGTCQLVPGCMNTCGNGKIDPGEQCDDGPNNGKMGDPCLANCTLDINSKCGNGTVDPGEECDDGKNNSCMDHTMATCSCTCHKLRCGDGIIEGKEQCDPGDNEFGMDKSCPGMMPCNKDCSCPSPGQGGASSSSSSSSGAGGNNCNGKPIVADVVDNTNDPTTLVDPPNIGSVWSYNGIKGYQAGVQMCQAIGADHPCSFTEIVAADGKGEIAKLQKLQQHTDLTFWLHRVTNAMDDLHPNTSCNVDSDCNQLPGSAASVCDPGQKLCAFKPGAGGRCNDWTYPTNHISNGEWWQLSNAPGAMPGGVTCTDSFCKNAGGSASYHIDRNTGFDGIPPAKGCKSSNAIGCSGPCSAQGNPRAILCCNPTCQ